MRTLRRRIEESKDLQDWINFLIGATMGLLWLMAIIFIFAVFVGVGILVF